MLCFYLQFYGECEVDSPKGTDVVKDAIRKRKVSYIIFYNFCLCLHYIGTVIREKDLWS